jgi:hypothetical protein
MMEKQSQLPIALRMAVGLAGGQMMLNESRRRVSELEEQAAFLNAQARRAEFERQASTIRALRNTQAPIVLGRGGMHPSFGYEVPVGMDQGMVRMAAVEMGKGMARSEMAFRKQALSLGNKLGLGAAAGLTALGGAGILADKGIRVANRELLQDPYANRRVPQMKLGQVMVGLHGGMDKESMGLMKSVYTGLKGGLLKSKAMYNTSKSVGAGTFGAASRAVKGGGTQGMGTYRAARIKPSMPVPKIEPSRSGTGGYAPKSHVPSTARTVPGHVEADPFPAAKAPGATSVTDPPSGFMGGVQRWGNKWIVNPARITARHPWSVAAGLGTAAAAYGGYRALKSGVDVMQQHNPMYTYNTGGYQLPNAVNEYGYTAAPGLHY